MLPCGRPVVFTTEKIPFKLVNCAHAQERVIAMMWRMSLDCSIPVNFFSILGF